MRNHNIHKVSALGSIIAQAAEKLGIKVRELDWFSWPQVFGSTSGPHGGISGQAMTTFQVYGFRPDFQVTPYDGLLYCDGKWKNWRDGELRWPT